jgi:hypothetical protein
MPDILNLADLSNQVGLERVTQYFDDDGDGVVVDADPNVISVLDQAEGQYYSRLLRAYGAKSTLILLANNDPIVKGHITWIACELMAERRVEFTNAEGWGAFQVQYNRAIKELDLLSKGQTRSVGEETVGLGGNSGGTVQAQQNIGTSRQFVFNPSKGDPNGAGGF